jgi:hypothetical protein
MTTNPDFDFQLGKNTRLRGWGSKGLLALFLILLTTCLAVETPGALKTGVDALVLHAVSSTGKPK